MHNELITTTRPHRSRAGARRTRRRRATWLSLSALALAAATVGQVGDTEPDREAAVVLRVEMPAAGWQ